MNREGYGLIIGTVLFTAVTAIGALTTPYFYLKVIAIIGFILTLFCLWFFRDPKRDIPGDANLVLSPGDGKVVDIQSETESEFIKGRATRVSVFLSVFDVHVNRVPVSGRVGFFRYQKGSFVNAYKSAASDVNEQTIIGIENGDFRMVFKQIAGLIARRIVCNLREGHVVKAGERCGIIKFGSRVDIIVPEQVDVKVNLKDRVKGGETVIGVMTNEV